MRGAPVFISTVMVCPSLSCSSLSGIPMFLGEHSQPGQRSAARRRRRDSTEREQHRAAEQRLKCGAAFRTPPHTHSPTCGGRAARQRTWACACPPALAVRGRGAAGAAASGEQKRMPGASAPPKKASSLGRSGGESAGVLTRSSRRSPSPSWARPPCTEGGLYAWKKCTFEAQAPLSGASFAAAQAAVGDRAKERPFDDFQ